MPRVALSRVPVPSLLQAMLVRLSGLDYLRPVLRLGRASGQVLGQLVLVMWQYRGTWVGVGTVRSLWPSWTHGSGTQLSGSTTWPTLNAKSCLEAWSA